MGKYLEEAKSFLGEALGELKRADRVDSTPLRDAAEKAWGAVVLATNELMERLGAKVAEGHSARKVFLHDLEKKEKRLRRLRLFQRYNTFMNILHRDCFYEGMCPRELIEDIIRDGVKAYLADVARATKGPL